MLSELNKAWRLLATGFCFVVFGAGGGILGLLWFPVCNLIYRDARDRQRVSRKTVQISFGFFVRLMCLLGVIRVSLSSEQNLSGLRGKVVIANHPSLIDVVVLASLVPDADCVVKGGLWQNPFIKGVINATGYINNKEPEGLLEDCKASLQKGSNLIIFPEGTRTPPGKRCGFRRGAANIALRAGADLQPVFIRISPPFLTKGLPWYKVPETRVHVSVEVGEPYSIQQYATDKMTVSVRRLTRDIESLFNTELMDG